MYLTTNFQLPSTLGGFRTYSARTLSIINALYRHNLRCETPSVKLGFAKFYSMVNDAENYLNLPRFPNMCPLVNILSDG